MSEKNPTLFFAIIFGCVAYSLVEKQFRKKIDKSSKMGIFCWTSEKKNFHLIEKKIKLQKSGSVSLDETKFYIEKKIKSEEEEN